MQPKSQFEHPGWDYEVAQTYGGVGNASANTANVYPIRSPFNTDCEMCPLCVTIATAGGSAWLTNIVNPSTTQNVLFSNVASDLNGQVVTPGYVISTNVKLSIPLLEIWQPVRNEQAWYFVVPNGTTAFVTVAWRRVKAVRHVTTPVQTVTDPMQEHLLRRRQEEEYARERNGTINH